MKTLQFIYQDTQIHFALQNEGNVMINATEMAKAFNKRIDVFLKAEHTKKFINKLEENLNSFPPNGGNENLKVLETNVNLGTYMHEVLALKFAAWLDVDFELWVYKKIQNLVFGNYKKHWDAHQQQIQAEEELKLIKEKLYISPDVDLVKKYFETETAIQKAKSKKRKAIANQLKIEF